jgi:hypothetical protein
MRRGQLVKCIVVAAIGGAVIAAGCGSDRSGSASAKGNTKSQYVARSNALCERTGHQAELAFGRMVGRDHPARGKEREFMVKAQRFFAGGLSGIRIGNLCLDAGAPVGRAIDIKVTVEGFDPRGKAAQARALCGVGAADAVVENGHRRAAVRSADAHRGARRAGVLRHVCDRLRHDVVRRRLDRGGKPLFGQLPDLDRHGRPLQHRIERWAETMLGEQGGV